MSKYIFVTGGVVSGLGKGITAASLGTLLKARGYSVSIMKMDPYVNVDAGTMNPLQHGEVFVTDDGAQTDMDLGHYERFIDRPLSALNNVTTGQIYGAVIKKEREGCYKGSTVQVIPHVTDEIKERIKKVAETSRADIVINEIGGTVGDIESLPFLEAIRQFRSDVGPGNTLYVHVTLVPYISTSGEQKTKPTQHSVAELRSIGIAPDAVVCRSTHPLSQEARDKLALFCNLEKRAVIQNLDARSIYEVPLQLEKEGFARLVEDRLHLPRREPDLSEWYDVVRKLEGWDREFSVAVVGKYVALRDAYKSVAEALVHGGLANGAVPRVKWVDSASLTPQTTPKILGDVDGIVLAGGLGHGGISGAFEAVRYARTQGKPFFGISFGFQCAVVEIARDMLALDEANSTEFDPDTPCPVVDLMPEQKGAGAAGGAMRLGLHKCLVKAGTLAHRAYGQGVVMERHRHRFQVNPRYVPDLARAGFLATGIWPGRGLVEIMELEGHPWFLGTQFHPELLSRPNRPHPLFRDFVAATLGYRSAQEKSFTE